MKPDREWFGRWLLFIFPAVIATIAFFQLPERIPIHWNLYGQVDRWGARGTLWILPAIILLLGILSEWLPRRAANYEKFAAVMNRINFGLALFLNAVMLWVVYLTLTTLQQGQPSAACFRFMPAALGLLFLFIGNLMPKLRPNRWVGIRVSWTMANEEVWRRTHRLAGYLMAGAGIVMIFSSLLIPNRYQLWLLPGVIAVMVLLPVWYARQTAQRLKRIGADQKKTL